MPPRRQPAVNVSPAHTVSVYCRVFGTYLVIVSFLVYVVTLTLRSNLPLVAAVFASLAIFVLGPPLLIFSVFTVFTLIVKVEELLRTPPARPRSRDIRNGNAVREPHDTPRAAAFVVPVHKIEVRVMELSKPQSIVPPKKQSLLSLKAAMGALDSSVLSKSPPVAMEIRNDGDAVAALEVIVETRRYSSNPDFGEDDNCLV